MPWDRRGDFSRAIKNIRQAHGYVNEIKWNKVKPRYQGFFLDLVDEFFKRTWLMFHGMIVRKGWIDKAYHNGDYDLAFRKNFSSLLTCKIAQFARGFPEKRYRIHVDPIKSSYGKADEAARIITGHSVRQRIGMDCIDSLRTRDSKDSLGIQLSDLFIGAILSPWQRNDIQDSAKLAVRNSVAEHLGWRDLKACTFPTGNNEWKFNIWYLENPRKREAPARRLNLMHRMPDWHTRS